MSDVQRPVRRRADDRTSVARLKDRTGALFTQCLTVFQVFADLPELAENLRVLSLNAELAAGRAGEKGRAVRALTQYTRELVNRLGQLRVDMDALEARTNGVTANTLKELHLFDILDRAHRALVARGCSVDTAALAKARIEGAWSEIARRITVEIGQMLASVERLAERARQIEEVVNQSDSIATNIAVEAAAAGVYEGEFRTVADTMRRYVTQLRSMVDRAVEGVWRAQESGEAVRALGIEAARRM